MLLSCVHGKCISASVMRDDTESPKPRPKAELTDVALEESSTCLSRTPDPQLAASGQTGVAHIHAQHTNANDII